jgi:pimeloyl-[acyl-carrier protein] synthase
MTDSTLFPPQVRRDPYPMYDALRSDAPLQFVDGIGRWVASGHAECTAVLRDERFGTSFVASREEQGIADRPLLQMLSNWMLFMDPPAHARLRRLVNRAFTPRAVQALRPRVQQLVDGYLDAAAQRGHMDVITDLARPLPIVVIAELLGVDPELFSGSGVDAGAVLDPVTPPEVLDQLDSGLDDYLDEFRAVLRARRTDPRDDLMTGLAQVDELSEDEIVATCTLLFEAGHETTVNLIGNGTLALLRHPDQLARLRDDTAIDELAVDELLRFDAPVQLTARVALDDAEIAGERISAGEHVVCLLAAANHDPAVFDQPDRLDLGRHPNPHLSFSAGIHFCLGAALARIEGQIAITSLIRRFPNLAVATEDLQWRTTITLRGLASLPVNLGTPA